MDRVSRGSGFGGAVRYIFANFKASFLCASNALAARDERRAISKMGVLAHRLRPDIRKPVWHQALRLPRGEAISHKRYREIADEYMRRMGWNSDRHQYIIVVSDDPAGQHIHIVANRVGIDGSIYLGKNENLISTRVCQELERDYGLAVTKGPEYVVDERGIPRAVYAGPTDRKPKKGELRLIERQAREGVAEPLPRKALQRILRGALKAGETGGLGAFLAAAETGGIRVLANMASTGRVNGLSFEAGGGVPFKASAIGDAYAWAALASAVRYDQARDRALLEARSLRHVTRHELPPLGQPAPFTQPPAPPAAANPIVIQPAAKEATDYVQYQSSYRACRPAASPPRWLARTPALDGLRSLPRGRLDDSGGWARRESATQGVLSRDSQLVVREPVKSGRGLRHPARGAAEPAAAGAGRGVERNPSLLDAAREAQAVRELFGDVRDEIAGTGQHQRMLVVVVSLSSALADFRPKGGKLGTLYIRESTDTYSFISTPEVVKVALIEPDVVRAALAVAEQRWPSLTIRGSEEFKRVAAREAVRLGLADRIANPELQSFIALERAHMTSPQRDVFDSSRPSAPAVTVAVPNMPTRDPRRQSQAPGGIARRTLRPR